MGTLEHSASDFTVLACAKCNGRGSYPCTGSYFGGEYEEHEGGRKTCTRCDGTGRVRHDGRRRP